MSQKRPLHQNVYLLMLFASVLIALAQFCFKLAAEQAPTTAETLLQPMAWLGIGIYVASFPLNLYTYRLAALSHAFPLLSLSLVWSAGLGVAFLGDVLGPLRLVGGGLIIAGSLIIGSEV